MLRRLARGFALAAMEGKTVPNVTIPLRENNAWKSVSTGDLFKGKTVIVFSLPGAFTPTCSTSHLPRYEELAPVFFSKGVDAIYCVSVNDTFVMDSWGRAQGAKHVKLLPDGNGDFTKEMGLLVDKSAIGFGKRSWRYSMLVKDGKVVKQFIEPEEAGDPFKVSDADTMLAHISPGYKVPGRYAVLAKEGCPHCERAKEALQKKGLDYSNIVVDQPTLIALSGQRTWPQVFQGGKLIPGGADGLIKAISD